MKFNFLSVFNKLLKAIVSGTVVAIAAMGLVLSNAQTAEAYPFWAQENYETPREATGKIVCANCHLGKKKTEIEVPQAVLPDTVFEAVVKVPYDLDSQQVLGDGSKGGLNVGAVLMLPDGFQLAPEDRIPEEMKEEIGSNF
ncbi:MAG: apocytochrome f, partial [Cyanobacteria bacterium P01_D01_bin.56]